MSGLKRLYRSLGPRWSLTIAAVVAAGLAAAVIAIAATGSGSSGRRVASVSSGTSGATQSAPPIAAPPSPPKRRHRAKPRMRPSKRHTATTKTTTTPTTTPAAAVTPSTPAATPSQTPAAGPISVDLHGGGDVTVTACGETHHYRTYAARSRIAYTGTVSPIPHRAWKVKLKIKICRGGSFVDYEKLDATRNKHTGAFSGTFKAPRAGLYYARADLYLNGSESSESDHVHFKIL